MLGHRRMSHVLLLKYAPYFLGENRMGEGKWGISEQMDDRG